MILGLMMRCHPLAEQCCSDCADQVLGLALLLSNSEANEGRSVTMADCRAHGEFLLGLQLLGCLLDMSHLECHF
jgi:hypothetical protein